MSPEKICDLLKQECAEAVVATAADASLPHVLVAAERWVEVAELLRADMRLNFNLLRSITGLDLLEDNKLAAVYGLHAIVPPGPDSKDGLYELLNEFTVRVEVDRDNPHIPSVSQVWPAAEWHEREAYDLFGIVFDNHPDSISDHDGHHPRRILCPDDWVGYPLRKDYRYPLEYHGIPGTTEYELTSPKH